MGDADVELEFYERFFLDRGLEPYPVQEQAIGRIFAGEDLLVTVPTGTGKTLMAKAGILRALRSGRTAIYTTPLRALTEEKFRELQEDFGHDKVGFATGDYKVNPEAPIQVLVAEILWNRIYGDQSTLPADIVIMDEGHYFNDPERGYVWEQSVIGLHPNAQLVILSATVGSPQQFCQWAYSVRRKTMHLVQSTERKVPLIHEFRESYLIEVIKALHAKGDVPALVFSFGRKLCFERARLLKACPKFVSKEEQAAIEERMRPVLLDAGLSKELEKLLTHGIGVHHAGVLPVYRRLVEELTVDRLLKVVVTTETIAAGINLPAKRCVFPSLRKYIKKKARLLTPAEYHQMAGRAGRPQFDSEGIAITLAPEEVVQDMRKEIKDAGKRGGVVDEEKIRKRCYSRAKTDARAKEDVTWDSEAHAQLVKGEPEALQSRTRVTAEQILAIGLPDLTMEALPGQAMLEKERSQREAEEAERSRRLQEVLGGSAPPDIETDRSVAEPPAPPNPPAEPASESAPALRQPPSVHAPGTRRLDIIAVIDNLLLPEGKRLEAHKQLAMVTRNLQALGVLDAQGRQIDGHIIGSIRGLDGPFIFYLTQHAEIDEALAREIVEFLVDSDAVQRVFDQKEKQKRRQWVLERLRELRRENPHLTFEDVEAMYDEEHPYEPTSVELHFQAFSSSLPHPELHGGKRPKRIWAEMLEEDLTFTDYVERHDLMYEEGSLFTYLARVMKAARMLQEVTFLEAFAAIETRVRHRLAAVDERVLEGLW
ncbi:MAG: DEAD/DEAH box helicase [Myxococcota bacterium]